MNPHHRARLLLAFSLQLSAFSLSLRAQPAPQFPVPPRLDLKGAMGFAIENNFAIRQARERIKQQDGVLVEISARQIPTVTAAAAYQQNDTEIAQSFPSSDRAWSVSLTASQVLYAGGGVKASVRGSQLVRESAVLDLQATINDALLQVRTNFYAVLLAREKITVQEKNLVLLQEQLKTATDRYNAGTVSSFEKLRAEVAVANAKAPLITAKNDFRLAIESLRQSLGFTTNLPDQLDKLPEFLGTLEFSPTKFDMLSALDAAHANRPELQRLAKLSSSREQSITVARSNSLPNVSAFGGWQLRKGPGSAFSESKDGWLLGVQSQWNIFDGRATAGRVAQARSALEQTKLSLAEATLAAEVEVRRAFSQWQQAEELADASKKVVEQAEEAVRLATARYNAGTATQLDVLQAQTDLTTSRTNQVQAYYAYNVGVATLRRAMGQPDELLVKP
ncbi:MAG: hypothetical protein RLZZ15_1053 [Verrucomicrobiota bacterium]|jgi:outer membrane protein TolC